MPVIWPRPRATTWFQNQFIDATAIDDNLTDPLDDLYPTDSGGWVTLSVTAANFSAGTPAPKYQWVTLPNGTTIVSLIGIIQRSVAIVSGAGFNGAGIFAALPVACRPSVFNIYVGGCPTAGTKAEFEVLTDGTIQIRNTGTVDIPANTNIAIGQTYIAG